MIVNTDSVVMLVCVCALHARSATVVPRYVIINGFVRINGRSVLIDVVTMLYPEKTTDCAA